MLALAGLVLALAARDPAVLRPEDEVHELRELQQSHGSPHLGTCNLCARNFTILLATGRSGSTSILEALNSLPGVHLRGENHASLWAAYELFRRATAEGPNAYGAPAYEHGPISEQQLLCTLQDFFEAFDPPDAGGSAPRVLGFKELVMPGSLANVTGTEQLDSDEEPRMEHLVDEADDWLGFLQRLFPCARVIFNYRRDTTGQANSTFFHLHNVTSATMDRMNERMLERFSTGGLRSFLMPLEDFTPEGATRMAHWLGFPGCTFRVLPHANDPDSFTPTSGQDEHFHTDYEHVNLICTNEDDVGQLGGDATVVATTTAPRRRAPTFFLHEDLGEPFRDVEAAMRTLYAHGSLDQHMPITHAEHLHDLYLLDALRDHPQRSYDASTANLHFTSALIGASAMLATTRAQHDGAEHWARVEAFANRLLANPSFRDGRPFFLQISVPTGLMPLPLKRAEGRDPLFEMLMSSPASKVILGTTDPAYSGLRTALMNDGFARYAVLPYRAHALLSQDRSIPHHVHRARDIDIFFRGNTQRDDNGLRATMLDTVDRLRPSRRVDVRSVMLTGQGVHWDDAAYVHAAAAVANSTAVKMRNAELCLCPAGDTSSSRRLYDALAAGCVPVIIMRAGGNYFNHIASPSNVSNAASLWLHAQRFLPFPDVIDWTSIAFYWVDNGVEDGQRFLHELSSPAMGARRQMMRAAGRQAFNAHLDTEFNARSVVSSILANEAAQMARPAVARQTETTKTVAASARQCLGAGSFPSGGRVVFIKTHKTASGSVFSMLARAAVTLNLNVAVPREPPPGRARDWGWPGSFPDGGEVDGRNAQYLRQGAPFDVIMHHANLDPHAMSRAAPGAPFVTIIRDPATQFVSAWDYFYGGVNNPWGGRGLAAFGVSNLTSGFPTNATVHVGGGVTESMPINTWTERAAFVARVGELDLDFEMIAQLINPNARQLGWPLRQSNGTAGESQWLAAIDEQFDLIMMQERFNESLVLLGRCLGLDPVRFQLVPPSEESHAAKHVPHSQALTEEDREAIYRLSRVDKALFDHGNARFDEQFRAMLAEEENAHQEEAPSEIARTFGQVGHEPPSSPWWTAFSTTVGELESLADDWALQCHRQGVTAPDANSSAYLSQCQMWSASELAITNFLTSGEEQS